MLDASTSAWVASYVGPVASVRPLVGGLTSTMLAITPHRGDEVVLRVIDREPWRTHGAGLADRESRVQTMLHPTVVPAPVSVGIDAAGEHCGDAAHLMSLLPGAVDLDRVDPGSLDRLAAVLAGIHAVEPTIAVRDYQSWAFEAKYVVPGWTADPGLWEAAFDLLRSEPASTDWCLVHRDFHLRNVLWSGAEVAGVVDWVETSRGPAWLDVAHCCTNLAIGHGEAVAQAFAAAYVARTGRVREPWVEVMDVVGFLPPPGRAPFALLDQPPTRGRLEGRLRAAMTAADR